MAVGAGVGGGLGWLVPLAVQVVHTLAVAPTYHVGSFDDDGNYLMAAHVLASGGGLTSLMPSGATVVANYLPGYPLLLVPLIWAWGTALAPLRLFSTLCTCALYPLLWAWMGRPGSKARPADRRPVAPGDQHCPGHLLDHGDGGGPLYLGARAGPGGPGPMGAPTGLALGRGGDRPAGLPGLVERGRHRPGRRAGPVRTVAAAVAPSGGGGRRDGRPAVARAGRPAGHGCGGRRATATGRDLQLGQRWSRPSASYGGLGRLGLPQQRPTPDGAADGAPLPRAGRSTCC